MGSIVRGWGRVGIGVVPGVGWLVGGSWRVGATTGRRGCVRRAAETAFGSSCGAPVPAPPLSLPHCVRFAQTGCGKSVVEAREYARGPNPCASTFQKLRRTQPDTRCERAFAALNPLVPARWWAGPGRRDFETEQLGLGPARDPRASTADSPQLFEQSEQSERRGILRAARVRAAGGTGATRGKPASDAQAPPAALLNPKGAGRRPVKPASPTPPPCPCSPRASASSRAILGLGQVQPLDEAAQPG